MSFIKAGNIMPGDVVLIDGAYDHDDLAGLSQEVDVVAVAHLIENPHDVLIYPNDSRNPAPYIFEQAAGLILRHREVPDQKETQLTIY